MSADILAIVRKLAKQYPEGSMKGQVGDFPRIAYDIELMLYNCERKDISEIEVCD